MHEWLKGYERLMAHLGYAPQSAHPWTSSDLLAVLVHLDQQKLKQTGTALLKLLRDAFAMTILWESCSRGCTALSWQLRDILKPDGTSPCSYLCVSPDDNTT